MKRYLLLIMLISAGAFAAEPADLDHAEVRLPYAELLRLLTEARSEPVPEAEPPIPAALLSARYRMSFEDGIPALTADFRADHLDGGWHLLPLLGGSVSLESVEPEKTRVIAHEGQLCLLLREPGSQSLSARFQPIEEDPQTYGFQTPPCSAPVLEIPALPVERGLRIEINGQSQTLGGPTRLPLPVAGARVVVRLIDTAEAEAALLPPEPSNWSWQHQAVVMRHDGQLHYRIFAHASASDGSGIKARLRLPDEAREIQVEGDDLVGHGHRRHADGSRWLEIEWKGRDILDRELVIDYRMPLRPLDPDWTLAAPAAPDAEKTRTRFLIAGVDQLAYTAETLTGPFDPATLPARLAKVLGGHPWFLIEGQHSSSIQVKPLPVAATADAVMVATEWIQQMEPDGASLTRGSLKVDHRTAMRVPLRLPEATKLLTCTVANQPVSPVQRDDGTLEIPLPPPGVESPTLLEISYTSRVGALDPLEGVIAAELPTSRLFVHELTWTLKLPPGYRAEVSGNLTRLPTQDTSRPSDILLGKKLLRAETPAARIFYTHNNILH
ncbi:hypothetical protein [Haloferula sp. A504]|uniref:hypothetical protein n=1 Tax=Haloferula sp. A504 TaxID=3373601 RepID=UPI0031C15E15|nr:hypothetical protein [Verrucomicrobiaceae bacterium E54]